MRPRNTNGMDKKYNILQEASILPVHCKESACHGMDYWSYFSMRIIPFLWVRQLKRYICLCRIGNIWGAGLARAFIIQNPFQCLLFRSFGFGILPLSRDDCLGCSNKRSYKKSMVSGEQ